jgi:hypothetical protein
MNITDKKIEYCEKNVSLPLYYGSYKDECAKQAVAVDIHGRHLCQKHYNQWLKRYNKNENTQNSKK